LNGREKVDEKDKFEERARFEHQLLNTRVTWLLSSQTILFAAYGLSISEYDKGTLFREVIPLVGIVLSGIILIGIVAAFLAKIIAWEDLKRIKGYENEPIGVRTWITCLGYIPDFFIPIVFALAWSYLLCHSTA